jgi:hypothetical protein
MRIRERPIQYRDWGHNRSYPTLDAAKKHDLFLSEPGWGSRQQMESSLARIEDVNNGATYRTARASKRRSSLPNSPCFHVAIRSSADGFMVHQASPSLFVAEPSPRGCTALVAPLRELSGQYAARLSQQVQAKLKRMSAPVKEVSLINNLLEMDDIPKLLTKYRKIGAQIKDLSVLRQVNLLDYQFGVKPLLRDLETLIGNMANAETRYNRLIAGMMIPVSGRESNQFGGKLTFQSSSFQSDTILVTCRHKGLIRATYPGITEASQSLGLAFDMIGLHIDASVAWDALPFSWLADWFVPIGDFIDQQVDRRWIRPSFEGGISYSVSMSGFLKHTQTTLSQPVVYQRPNSVEFTSYQRDYCSVNTFFQKYADVTEPPGGPYVPKWNQGKSDILLELARAQTKLGK